MLVNESLIMEWFKIR